VVAARRIAEGELAFVPVVDGVSVPEPPLAAIAEGASAGVPLLVGTNLDEMRFFAIADRPAFTLDDAALQGRLEVLSPGVGQRAVAAYAAARSARGEGVTPAELWFAITSDRLFRIPCTRMAEAHAAHQPATYSYLFTWPSPVFGGVLGSCHALELPFLFGKLGVPNLALFAGAGPDADLLGRRMQDAWLAFARTGDPSHPGIGSWPPYDPARRATMVLDRTCAVVDAPLEAERSFWDAVDA
jgi:para-nitrobenzyl esterase